MRNVVKKRIVQLFGLIFSVVAVLFFFSNIIGVEWIKYIFYPLLLVGLAHLIWMAATNRLR